MKLGVRGAVVLAVLGQSLVVALPAVPAAASPCEGRFCVGAASTDMTWHVGAGQGQLGGEGNGVTADKFDPFHHQTKMVPTDGIQARNFAKAIVVQGADGTKVAYVKTDLYLQQDVLTRRVAQLIEGTDDLVGDDYAVEGLDGAHVMLGTTHNHSAPYYATTAAGVWAFADAFDFRMFEATARQVARAIKDADGAMRPARMGASVSDFDLVQRNIIGPGVADDGSPAGFPSDYFDDDLSVVRFDALDGEPIAMIVNLGMHPESTDGVDLMSADFVGMVERMVERTMGRVPGAEDGPVVAWSQGSVGDVEPDQAGLAHPIRLAREYWRKNFAQAELMSRDISAAVLDTWRDIRNRTPGIPARFVPMTTSVPVAMLDHRFAGPPGHPIPTVSNCRTSRPGVPVVGLPDCERPEEAPEEFGTTIDLLQDAGLPLPDNYGAAGYTGVQESLRIHLQVMRLGEVILASCPCEPITDMVLNLKSRIDRVSGNQRAGFVWPCRVTDGETECNFQRAAHSTPDWRPVSPEAVELMRSQVNKDAMGWEEDFAALGGESESSGKVYGNFSSEELPPTLGYRLPIMVGQANDYVGYIVTYREYMRGDHYRKALTAFGPHTADYVNTRLVRMAGALKGGEPVADAFLDPAFGPADEMLQLAKTFTAGTMGTEGTAAYEAAVPDDGGLPGIESEPSLVAERFSAVHLTWIGGSNWTDNPVVIVERKVRDQWVPAATQEGEIVVTLAYDSYLSAAPLEWLTGAKTYHWTATFELFERTVPGVYRFTVGGAHRSGRVPVPYELTSRPFRVLPWTGIVVKDLRRDAGGVSFTVDGVEGRTPEEELETDDDARLSSREVHYPDSYEAGIPFISHELSTRDGDPHRYCYRCTFRPWADSGVVVRALVTVTHADGTVSELLAGMRGSRWTVGYVPRPGDAIVVRRGSVIDGFGNTNGMASNVIRV
ncbi:MAG TPA: neutral/alkaline non-lysosomal ceramidase N-terminal domain-containing protein [Actinomycetota bacterium]|nr:neutral/alkaline non-lysosomal ceramidase N-terminal domain-containing protein [Actinomycetota bacterium]